MYSFNYYSLFVIMGISLTRALSLFLKVRKHILILNLHVCSFRCTISYVYVSVPKIVLGAQNPVYEKVIVYEGLNCITIINHGFLELQVLMLIYAAISLVGLHIFKPFHNLILDKKYYKFYFARFLS